MLKELNEKDVAYYQKNKKALAALIQKNVEIKVKVVQKDEFEQGDRKLLNFGHTLGHAIENEHALLHGHAISIGMVYAAKISQVLLGFTGTGLLKHLKNMAYQPRCILILMLQWHSCKKIKRRPMRACNMCF